MYLLLILLTHELIRRWQKVLEEAELAECVKVKRLGLGFGLNLAEMLLELLLLVDHVVHAIAAIFVCLCALIVLIDAIA